MARPFSVEGVDGAGVGGANMRMKSAKASMSERAAALVEPAAVVKLMVSSGVGLKRQPGVSSRSCGKSWSVLRCDFKMPTRLGSAISLRNLS